jgi:hypothetical protein
LVDAVHPGYLTLKNRADWDTAGCVHNWTSSLVNKKVIDFDPVNHFLKVFTIVIKKLFPSKSISKDAISHYGDSIEGAVKEYIGLTVLIK